MQGWQSSEDALLQMVVVILVRLAAGNNVLPGWDDLGTGVQLLLVRSKFSPTINSSVHALKSDP